MCQMMMMPAQVAQWRTAVLQTQRCFCRCLPCAGTTAASLAAGTPQLLCPLQFDQFYWVRQFCATQASCGRSFVGAAARPAPEPRCLFVTVLLLLPCLLLQAERVADLGCSPGSRLTAEQLMPSDSSSVPQAAALLAAQVQAARQPCVLACCRSLQQMRARVYVCTLRSLMQVHHPWCTRCILLASPRCCCTSHRTSLLSAGCTQRLACCARTCSGNRRPARLLVWSVLAAVDLLC